jgi:predicted esterase
MLRSRVLPILPLVLFLACGDDADGTGGGTTATTTNATMTISSSLSSTGGGGADTCDTLACGDGSFCYDGACRPCGAPLGSQSDQVLPLGDGEEDRFYFLHVPSSYDCGEPTPLLVDFHGTAGPPAPEEAYQNEAAIALAEAEGAIVVRPRSRSSEMGSFEIFRWDQNPGDLERNVTYAQNLVDALRKLYNVDPARLYASGFSSGANMTSQFFGDEHRGLFRGLAPIAGGYWAEPSISTFDGDAPRAYVATGYRDYLYGTTRDLLESLDAAGVPEDAIFFRETDTGHELYDWHFPELYAWLDRGERPEDLPLAAPWQAESVPTSASILAATTLASGEVLATTSAGEVLRRDVAGTWTVDAVSSTEIALTSICASSDGATAYAAGEGYLSKLETGSWSAPEALPEIGTPMLGLGYVNGIACSGATSVAGVGYWNALRSDDAAGTWSEWLMPAGPGYEAQGASVAIGPSGTAVAVGYYNYVGRSTGGADLAAVSHQAVAGWWNDVASGPGGLFLAAGDTGAVVRSVDDGASWFSVSVAASGALYVVAIAPDGLAAVAAGLHGDVFFTRDGGGTWASAATGLDRFVGAATFLDADTVLIAGERGTLLRADLPR